MFNVNGDQSIVWSGKGKCVDLTDGKHTAGNVVQVSTRSSVEYV
jgi:hypothetical protein